MADWRLGRRGPEHGNEMTDFALLADNTQAIADAMEAAYDEGDQGAIVGVLKANAAAFAEMANGGGTGAPLPHDTALREFYGAWKPFREGREVTGLEPKIGPSDLARLWMKVGTKDHATHLAAIIGVARHIAKEWALLTPVVVAEAMTPEEFSIGRVMGPSSRGEGDDEAMVYKTVAREDLTSSQAAQFKVDQRPPDMSAAQDSRLQGLVYALVHAVNASENT